MLHPLSQNRLGTAILVFVFRRIGPVAGQTRQKSGRGNCCKYLSTDWIPIHLGQVEVAVETSQPYTKQNKNKCHDNLQLPHYLFLSKIFGVKSFSWRNEYSRAERSAWFQHLEASNYIQLALEDFFCQHCWPWSQIGSVRNCTKSEVFVQT